MQQANKASCSDGTVGEYVPSFYFLALDAPSQLVAVVLRTCYLIIYLLPPRRLFLRPSLVTCFLSPLTSLRYLGLYGLG